MTPKNGTIYAHEGSRVNESTGYPSPRQDDDMLLPVKGGMGIDGMLGPSGRLQPNDALGGPPRSKIRSGLAIANSVSAGYPSGLGPPP